MTRFEPIGPLRGSLHAPPDKSISHRAALLAAMGEGESAIEGYLDSADTRSTLAAIGTLGVRTRQVDADPGRSSLSIRISGSGLHGPAGERAIDVGNAGTLLRLLPGWLAGQPGRRWTLDGDESIRRRPVDRIAEPLRRMGAEVESREGRFPPLTVRGSALRGIDYRLPVASAQVKSCILLAGLLAEGATTVVESTPTRDHTERMLAAAGASVRREGNRVAVEGAERLALAPVEVPGDFSSAAFWLAAALIVPGSEVTVEGLGLNPTRTGLLTILHRMGADVKATPQRESAGEPVGRLVARHSPLRATEVAGGEIPLAIDELPLVGLLGCFAEGTTRVAEAGELRHKESDRIGRLVAGLRAAGGDARELEDGFVVNGGGVLRGGRLEAFGDHRLAMLGAIAGLASQRGVEVDGMAAAAVSYPGFQADLSRLSAR